MIVDPEDARVRLVPVRRNVVVKKRERESVSFGVKDNGIVRTRCIIAMLLINQFPFLT